MLAFGRNNISRPACLLFLAVIAVHPCTAEPSGGRHRSDAGDLLPRLILREGSLPSTILDVGQVESVFREKTPFSMEYGVFKGVSSLRSLSHNETRLLHRRAYVQDHDKDDDKDETEEQHRSCPAATAAFYRAASLLFVIRGKLEVAHELVLGVTPHELDTAEYAATHPGQTSWSKDHPLTDSADRIHALIHRLEGSALGEGNHSGFDNAKYWILGGPKLLDKPADHWVKAVLEARAPLIAPLCVARRKLLSPRTSSRRQHLNIDTYQGKGTNKLRPEHSIPVAGGKTRAVLPNLKEGEWDDLAFIDLCRLREGGKVLSEEECKEIMELQRLELLCLLQFELEQAGLFK